MAGGLLVVKSCNVPLLRTGAMSNTFIKSSSETYIWLFIGLKAQPTGSFDQPVRVESVVEKVFHALPNRSISNRLNPENPGGDDNCAHVAVDISSTSPSHINRVFL